MAAENNNYFFLSSTNISVLSGNKVKVSFLSQIEFAIFCDMLSIKLAIAIG